MKLTNTLSEFDTKALRRMTVWLCNEVGIRVRDVPLIQFRRSRSAWSGRYYPEGHISVRVGVANQFPARASGLAGEPMVIADQWESLVMVTAHELTHRLQHKRGILWKLSQDGRLERMTEGNCRRVLLIFRQKRDQLLAEWMAAATAKTQPKAKPTAAQLREARARQGLERWEKRLRAAERKVAEYRKRVRYYDRKRQNQNVVDNRQAACPSGR